ncbi:MAG TPA: hypothetical protein VGC10_02935 [Sphingomonas sp.]
MTRAWCLLPMIACAGVVLADAPSVPRIAVAKRAMATFAAADADHDGWLTREEYRAAILAEARRYDPKVPAAGKGMDMVMARFDALDTAHQGRIARQAYVAEALSHFDGADLNHDGIVTSDEARKAQDMRLKAPKKAAPPK